MLRPSKRTVYLTALLSSNQTNLIVDPIYLCLPECHP